MNRVDVEAIRVLRRSVKILIVLGTVAPLLLAACGDGTTKAADGGATDGAVVSDGAGNACDPTYKCSAAIGGGNPANLCAGTIAATRFDELNQCACGLACAIRCADSVCAGKVPSADCLTCLQDKTSTGCGVESAACSSN